MEYHLRYEAGALKRGMRRVVLRVVFIVYAVVCVLAAVAAFGVAVWTKEVGVAVAAAAGGVTLAVLLALHAFLLLRETTGSFLPQGGDELILTTTESGLLAEMPALGTRSFFRWNMLQLLPLRAGDEMLCLVAAASGSTLLLPLHGLSAEESAALHAALAAAIEAAKQATANAAEPLPPPDGFGEPGIGISPEALVEGYDTAVWQKRRRRFAVGVCLVVGALLLLWVIQMLLPHTALFDRFSHAGFLCLLSLYALFKWCSLLRHPGRNLLRKMRRIAGDSTYAWNADGTALLIRRSSGEWTVFPLSLAEKAYQGERCCVLELRKKNHLVLPRELPLPAALPVQPARYRMPRWSFVFLGMLALSTAVSACLWDSAPSVEAAQHEKLMDAAMQQFSTSYVRSAEADSDAAARCLREGADKWADFETGWRHGSYSRQQIFRTRLAIFLYVWGERFPEQWQEVRETMPAEAQLALQEEQNRWADLLAEWTEMQQCTERLMAAVEEAQKTEEARAAAASMEEADAALQGLMAEWVQYCRDEDAWMADTGGIRFPEELMQRDAVLKARLSIWEEAFPVPYLAARIALPEPYRHRLIEETDGEEEEE